MGERSLLQRWAVRWVRWTVYAVVVRGLLVLGGHEISWPFALVVFVQIWLVVAVMAYVYERGKADAADVQASRAAGFERVVTDTQRWDGRRWVHVAAWSTGVLVVGLVIAGENPFTVTSILFAVALGLLFSGGSYRAALARDRAAQASS